MSFDKIGQFAASIFIAAYMAGNLDSFNRWVQVHTVRLLWESRTANWGSPRFFPENYKLRKTLTTNLKEVRNANRKQESN